MIELRPELRKLFAAARSVENPDAPEAPFGFAARVVNLAKAQPTPSPLSLLEAFIRRGALLALGAAVVTAIVIFSTGAPRVDIDAMSKPYAAVFALSR